MPESREIDLRAAINAISDVIENRPRPLREFDQIYMKAGDMVLQSELVARWADKKRLVFIGDGDAISICVAYLYKREIVNYGPSEIVVLDFDERICSAVTRFADREALTTLRAELYNCLEPLPELIDFDCFYTNPPWGASNKGESIKVFMQRGMEAISFNGEGMVVIADDAELEWPQHVLANIQDFAISNGFFVQKMMSQLHSYHLDDAPNLRSCNLIFKSLPGAKMVSASVAITEAERLKDFYGRDTPPKVRYIREKKRLDYGKAHDDEYSVELLETETENG